MNACCSLVKVLSTCRIIAYTHSMSVSLTCYLVSGLHLWSLTLISMRTGCSIVAHGGRCNKGSSGVAVSREPASGCRKHSLLHWRTRLVSRSAPNPLFLRILLRCRFAMHLQRLGCSRRKHSLILIEVLVTCRSSAGLSRSRACTAGGDQSCTRRAHGKLW